uniref:Uncharacterized protein n=1 Tax=Candidozyma auris TaxID=498019 RepID=A0A0L0NP25_CANAR
MLHGVTFLMGANCDTAGPNARRLNKTMIYDDFVQRYVGEGNSHDVNCKYLWMLCAIQIKSVKSASFLDLNHLHEDFIFDKVMMPICMRHSVGKHFLTTRFVR